MENERVNYARRFLKELSDHSGVSGYEHLIAPIILREFQTNAEEISTDRFGNIYAKKTGESGRYKIMLAAHMDEIGLMVKKIDPRGFIRFTTIGGVDQRTLISQEVIIHGRMPIPGVIGSMPPHLTAEDRDKAVKIEDMGIDVGLSYDEIKDLINIGDIITIHRKSIDLLGNLVSGKSLDDRAGVVVMQICLQELRRLHHVHDVIAVTTTQEEVGLRGAITSAHTLNPDLAIAIDVTHGSTPDTKGQVNIELGKGPTIALGPNIHPTVYKLMLDAAQDARIPHQIEPIAGMSGTDAWAIQVAQAGVPTGLLSLPLRYMHTSVETISIEDVVNAGLLLANFIARLPEDLEGNLCY